MRATRTVMEVIFLERRELHGDHNQGVGDGRRSGRGSRRKEDEDEEVYVCF